MNQLVLVPVFAFASILLLSAPIAVDTAETCSTNANSTSCCSANCGWFECTGNDTNAIKACMNLTDTDTINKTCSGSTNQTDLQSKCPAALTGCAALNESTCCSLTGCGLYKCNATAGCWNSSDVDTFKTNCESSSKIADMNDTCAVPTDTCTPITVDTDCCNTSGCGWFMCKDADDKLTGNGTCANNSTDVPISCISPATVQDKCTLPPTPTPTPITCQSKKDKDACCNTTGTGISCQWLNCTGLAMECRDVSASTEDCKVKDNVCTAPTPTPTPGPTPAPTTQAPTTQAPTAAPPASNTGMQHFDGASFVGGIILAVGVIAIAFFGCKFYKARKERNYHTL